MRLFPCLVLMVTLALPSFGGDFDLVIKTARETWPERHTVVVVCSKDASSMALMDLGSATENVLSLLVVDMTAAKDLERVLGNVTRKPRAEIFVLLIADDPITGEATDAGRHLVGRMTARGIPVVGTTSASIKLGAVFAQGPGTGDKVLSNPEVAKKLGVALPEPQVPKG